jgi:RimJ/RimL family protein N-acetyltransferase
MTDTRTITTDRLTMTPHSLGDFPELVRLWSDPQVVRFLGGAPHAEEDIWARLLRYAGSWALLGFGFWAVRTSDDGAYIGDVGFLEGRRSGVNGFDGDPEIGWSLHVAAQGKGYASEAVRGALGWGAVEFDGRFRRTVAMINPDNAASVAVAARCGFRHFSVARYKDAPTGLWEHRFPR